MLLILDSIAPTERIRLVCALGKASTELGTAKSAIDKIRAAGAVRAILAKLGTGPASPPTSIRIDPADKEASIRSLREYLSDGIKSVPDELRPFEQKMVVQLAAALGDRETVNRVSVVEQREDRETKQLAAFQAVAANGVNPGVDAVALAARVDDLRAKLVETAKASSARVARVNSELAALNARYRVESSRLSSEQMKAQREGRYVDADRLLDELASSRERYLAEFKAIKAEAEEHVASANRSMGRYDGYDELAPEGQKVIAAIMSASKISDADAKAWAQRQKIEPSTVAKLKRMGYKEAVIRQDMADFYRISGGRIPEIEITSTVGRAHASGITATEGRKLIAVGKRFDRTVLFHELAHHIEADEIAKAASNGFLVKRRRSPQVKLLSALTGNRGYSGSEVAYEDDFLHPYIGKVYRDGVTEVFSMGLEHLATPGAAALFAAKDPEMFAMVTGYLSQEVTPAMQAMLAVSTGATTARQEAASSLEAQYADAVETLAGKVKLSNNPDWDLKPGFRFESWVDSRMKKDSKRTYVGSHGLFHVYQGTVRGIRSRRWAKGHLILWDTGGTPDVTPIPADLNLTKAAIAISEKASQSLFTTYYNYIDSGYGDRRQKMVEFAEANS